MVKDNVSDFLAKLKNAAEARKPSIIFPYSKLVIAVAEVLQKEGYLLSVERKGKKMAKCLEATIAYHENKMPKLSGITRLSKPSRRVYGKAKTFYPVLNGLGRLIVSTPKGIMTGGAARKQGVGGELLFKIW